MSISMGYLDSFSADEGASFAQNQQDHHRQQAPHNTNFQNDLIFTRYNQHFPLNQDPYSPQSCYVSHTSFDNGFPTPTYTYSVLDDQHYSKHLSSEDTNMLQNNEMNMANGVQTFMEQHSIKSPSYNHGMIKKEEEFLDLAESSSENTIHHEPSWFNPLLTPIDSVSFSDIAGTPTTEMIYPDFIQNTAGSPMSDNLHHQPTSTPIISKHLSMDALIPYEAASPFMKESTTSSSTSSTTPTSSIDIKIKKAPSKMPKTATPRKTRRPGRKRKEREVAEFEHDAKPKSEQLRENEVIWQRILRTKKKGIYKCTHCTEQFLDLYQFANHIDVYKIVRPFKCPFNDCPWSILGLPRRAEIRRHCAAQHDHRVTFSDHCNPGKSPKESPKNEPGHSNDDKEDEKSKDTHIGSVAQCSFGCKYALCDRMFRRKDSYNRHEKLVHLNPESRFNKRIRNLQIKHKTNNLDILQQIIHEKEISKQK